MIFVVSLLVLLCVMFYRIGYRQGFKNGADLIMNKIDDIIDKMQ